MSVNGNETYYAKYQEGTDENEPVVEVRADLDEITNKCAKAEMNPLIWIRTSSPSSNLLEVLEPFKLTNFFEKVDKDETIDLQVVKKDLPWAEIDQYEVKDPASVKLIEDILDFSPELDAMLIKELDNLAKEKKIAM